MQAIPAVDRDTFRRTCGRFATGIAVATVLTGRGEPHGLTINSLASVSLEPPLVLMCIDYRCTILPHFREHLVFGVNILRADQRHLSVRFSGRIDDRFEGLDWNVGAAGAPLLGGCVAAMECQVKQIVEAGDHAIFIGEVLSASWEEGEPLVYFASGYRHLQTGKNDL